LRLGEKIWKMDFHKTSKESKKGEGGCGSVVCIGLECLCKVLYLKGKVVTYWDSSRCGEDGPNNLSI
jgi:hypothetical protein